METMHDITPSDTRRIARVVVLQNGGTAHGSQCRDLVAQLSNVLQSVKIAPAVIQFGTITPNRPGAGFSLMSHAFDDTANRCALFVGMANGTISVSAALDLMDDYDIQLTNTETIALFVMQSSATAATVRNWARAHALAALIQYATEYVSAGMLEARTDYLRMLADIRAYKAPSAIVAAMLALLAVLLLQLATLQFPDGPHPPDITPVVSLLIASAVLAPRAPQFMPSSGSVSTGSRLAGLHG
ncbi:hypothetical protein [Bifidobacterium myosotis]|uniref:Uncharacterized protein n=1 Tax=Bifidobacterium myosotis TaxID=1630166 RepID=A0A5M9ZJ49_9BIFI|nr:hypothetical protein [Bifidobacterium myosotis]KAA8827528.1 hypothetical protein EMO91_09010 [Bifidobacterium myosotis]